MPSPIHPFGGNPITPPVDECMDVASIDGGDVGMRATEEGAGEALHRTASAPELRMLLDPATAAVYNPVTHVLQPQYSGVVPSISSNTSALVPFRNAQVCVVCGTVGYAMVRGTHRPCVHACSCVHCHIVHPQLQGMLF